MSRRSTAWLIALCLTTAYSCNRVMPGGEGTDPSGNPPGMEGQKPPIAGLSGLSVTPDSVTLVVDNLGPKKTQGFRATGHFPDRPDEDVTALVNWSIDNPSIGAIDQQGLFTTSSQAGGEATVKAASGALSATARIEVLFQPIIRAGSAPDNAEQILPPSAMGESQVGNSPVIIYPSHQTLFPRNIYKVLFQWETGAGNDLFRLEFKSRFLTLSVYTTGDRWEPSAQQWAYMAATNAGGKVIWTVLGTSRAAPQKVWRSSSIDVAFSRNTVEGAIYYWSTTVAGVRRATVSDAAPTNFFTPAQTGNKCVACHTLSRNGTRLAADVGGHKLGVVDVKKIDPPLVSWSQGIATSWTTFSPDASRIVTANKGVLTLRDAMSGQALSTLAVGTGMYGTQPDWSPDGKLLAFVLSADDKDRGVSASSIATLEHDGGVFKNLKVIVASTGRNDSNFYPMFSPDSRFIAFAKTTEGNSDNNLSARLYLVPAAGGQPVLLQNANTIVSNQALSSAALGNTMPTWAPTRPGETAFIAFSSQRAYGKIYPYKKVDQLWVTALDLQAAPGTDPSFPAFRLPFQDLMEDNHRPFWAEDVLAPPMGTPDGGAGGDGGLCLPMGAECTSGAPCCAPLYCAPNGSGGYACDRPIG